MTIYKSISALFVGVALLQATFNSSPVFSAVIYQDNFESGQLLRQWFPSKENISIITTNGPDGNTTSAVQFHFPKASQGQDSFSELRFDLGQTFPELSIEFDLYIPSNYSHRSERPNNNKFFRLWTVDYKDSEKIGASMRSSTNGQSSLGVDYRKEEGIGMSTTVGGATAGFIAQQDFGKWMKVIIDIKSASNEQSGFVRIIKNDRNFLLKTVNNNYSDSLNGYQKGYLLGWANSGFNEDTNILIDNLEFHDKVHVIPKPVEDVIVD